MKMTSTQLLSVCILAVVHFALPQFTHDTADTEASSYGSSEQLMTANSQLANAVAQLQKDVAQLKTGSRQKNMNGNVSASDTLPRTSFCLFVDSLKYVASRVVCESVFIRSVTITT